MHSRAGALTTLWTEQVSCRPASSWRSSKSSRALVSYSWLVSSLRCVTLPHPRPTLAKLILHNRRLKRGSLWWWYWVGPLLKWFAIGSTRSSCRSSTSALAGSSGSGTCCNGWNASICRILWSFGDKVVQTKLIIARQLTRLADTLLLSCFILLVWLESFQVRLCVT